MLTAVYWIPMFWCLTQAMAQEAPVVEDEASPVEQDAVPAVDEADVQVDAPALAPAVSAVPLTLPVADLAAAVETSPSTTGLDQVAIIGKARGTHDIEVYVRQDGNLYLDDEILRDVDLAGELRRLLGADPESRLVVASDTEASHGRILEVLRLAAAAGYTNIALDASCLGGVEAAQQLFPNDVLELGGQEVAELDSGLSHKQLHKLKPKRWKFPQNPYGSTDFTAYTLEWGEAKVGLLTLDYGVLPRTQVGTVPLLDVVGIYNVNGKVNILREGPMDGAFLASAYWVPVTDLLKSLDERLELGVFDNDLANVDAQITYFDLGAMGSLRLAKPWSLHAGLHYAKLAATGDMDLMAVPTMFVPGLEDALAGYDLQVASITGELVQLKLASDLRLNRRDSIVLQFQAPFYARVRGITGAKLENTDVSDEVDILVAYGTYLPFDAGYRLSLMWQMSWKHWEGRVIGWGHSPIPYSWALDAADLSYRFGGKTRWEERRIRKGYRQNRKELRHGADVEEGTGCLPPDVPTPVEPAAEELPATEEPTAEEPTAEEPTAEEPTD